MSDVLEADFQGCSFRNLFGAWVWVSYPSQLLWRWHSPVISSCLYPLHEGCYTSWSQRLRSYIKSFSHQFALVSRAFGAEHVSFYRDRNWAVITYQLNLELSYSWTLPALGSLYLRIYFCLAIHVPHILRQGIRFSLQVGVLHFTAHFLAGVKGLIRWAVSWAVLNKQEFTPIVFWQIKTYFSIYYTLSSMAKEQLKRLKCK